MLVAVFIYWGWDSTVTVNEESRDAARAPARRRSSRRCCSWLIYVIVSIAAQAYDGPQTLIDNSDDVLSVLGKDVFGSPLDKILIIAVLTSAAASTQTTILPTARTSLSMARWGAMPGSSGASTRATRRRTSRRRSWAALSIVWYVGLTIVSENILFDSIAALGLMIAFYYGLTGFACTIYYRKRLTQRQDFLLIGVLPAARRPHAPRDVRASPATTSPSRPTRSPATRGSASGRRWSSGSGSCWSASCS